MTGFNETLAITSLLALGGTVTACWGQVKNFMARISTYAVVNSKFKDRFLINAVEGYLFAKFKNSKYGQKAYTSDTTYVRPLERNQVVGFEIVPESGAIFWQGRKPLWVTLEKNKEGNIDGIGIKFLRGTFNLERFIVAALDHYNAITMKPECGKRYHVNYVFGQLAQQGGVPESSPNGMAVSTDYYKGRPLKWAIDQLGPRLPPKGVLPTDLLILDETVKEAVREARFWKDSEKWYMKRSIPWKRGWLLHGKPGTGKTSLARAIAQELDIPVWVFDLASLSNQELRAGWTRMMSTAPCMALFEDIDATFNGRKNVAAQKKSAGGALTFDALLNALDGIERCDGLFVVITTNNIEMVDPAIGRPEEGGDSTRPGRIDRVVEMRAPSKEGLVRVAKRIVDGRPERWDAMAAEAFARGETVAQFQERCSRLAVKERWTIFHGNKGTNHEPIRERAAFAVGTVTPKGGVRLSTIKNKAIVRAPLPDTSGWGSTDGEENQAASPKSDFRVVGANFDKPIQRG